MDAKEAEELFDMIERDIVANAKISPEEIEAARAVLEKAGAVYIPKGRTITFGKSDTVIRWADLFG